MTEQITARILDLQRELHREKTIFWTLVGALFICAGFYIYFVNATIHNVVTRQNLQNEASRLTLSLGSQEFQYITMRNSITLDSAYALGFKDVADTTYLSRDSFDKLSYISR